LYLQTNYSCEYFGREAMQMDGNETRQAFVSCVNVNVTLCVMVMICGRRNARVCGCGCGHGEGEDEVY